MNSTNVKYLNGNIFSLDRTYPRIIIHSCNCNGSWGGGFAYQLAQRYPRAERDYMDICEKYGTKLLGKFVLIPSYRSEKLLIGCLFTSSFGGTKHDSGESILRYTKLSLDDMSMKLGRNPRIDQDEVDTFAAKFMKNVQWKMETPVSQYAVEMPKINSGIFGVPWERTEQVLTRYTDKQFTVYML